jgi:enoyl-CoA hydratase/carnithine racemase
VDVGLLPAQAMVPIMRTVNEKQGLKPLFTGERIDAARADEIGFTSEVVSSEAFDAELDDLVDDLAASSPVMIEMGKDAFYNQREMGFREALSYTREVIALVAMSEETEAGIEAFLMDEEPDWKGRQP